MRRSHQKVFINLSTASLRGRELIDDLPVRLAAPLARPFLIQSAHPIAFGQRFTVDGAIFIA